METVPNSSSGRATIVGRKSRQKSRVANGSEFIPGIRDGRSLWIRRAKEQLADFVSDLGGHDNTSAAERGIARRAAVLGTELERMEKQFAEAGEAKPDEIDLYARVAGNYRRLLEAIGIRRRARNITGLSFGDLLAADASRQRAERAAHGNGADEGAEP
jgi:hypothetical protein